jgi:glutamyl-tRNA reductase
LCDGNGHVDRLLIALPPLRVRRGKSGVDSFFSVARDSRYFPSYDHPGELMKLFVTGVSHRTTPVELRELLAVGQSQIVSESRRLKSHGELDEIVLLSTCNRVEIYGASRQATGRMDSLFRLLCGGQYDFGQVAYVYENLEAASHLFRVASGLDSMVLGETEIICQVKTAYDMARAARLTGHVLNRTFQKAFQTLKAIRAQTSIGRGATSVGSAAAELAERIVGNNFPMQKVMIIGAGQMGEACIRHLAKKGVGSILISNRSFHQAIELAEKFGGQVVPFDQCFQAIAEVDIVVTATACPNTLLRRADVEKVIPARRNRPLFLIDLSVPRNIDPEIQFVDNVYLYNIDDLEAIVRENVRSRGKDLAKCEQIIGSHAAALMAKLGGEKEALNQLVLESRPGWVTTAAANLTGQALLQSVSLATS